MGISEEKNLPQRLHDFHCFLFLGLSASYSLLSYRAGNDGKHEESFLTGPEMQVLDNGTPIRAGHADAKIYTHRAGDLYDLLASQEAVKPQGEWNHVAIRSVQGKLDY